MRKTVFAAALQLVVVLAMPVSAQDWDGWYLGIGAAHNSYTPDFVNGTKTFKINGFDQPFPVDEGSSAGAYLLGGHLWQRGGLVFGAELDIGRTNSEIELPPPVDVTEPFTFCGADPCIDLGTYGSLTTKAHIRGVLGYSMGPRFLGFVGLGVAVAESDPRGVYVRGNVDNLIGAATVSRDNRKTIFGPSLGLGGQYKLNAKLTLRAEVIHDMFRHKMDPVGGVGFGGTANDGTVVNVFYGTGSADGHIAEIESTTIRISAIWEF